MPSSHRFDKPESSSKMQKPNPFGGMKKLYKPMNVENAWNLEEIVVQLVGLKEMKEDPCIVREVVNIIGNQEQVTVFINGKEQYGVRGTFLCGSNSHGDGMTHKGYLTLWR